MLTLFHPSRRIFSNSNPFHPIKNDVSFLWNRFHSIENALKPAKGLNSGSIFNGFSALNRQFSCSSLLWRDRRRGKGMIKDKRRKKFRGDDVQFVSYGEDFEGGKRGKRPNKFINAYLKKQEEKKQTDQVNAQVSSLLFQLKQKNRQDSKLKHINVEFQGQSVQFKAFPELKAKAVMEDAMAFFGLEGVFVMQHKDDSLIPSSTIFSEVFGRQASVTVQLVARKDVYMNESNGFGKQTDVYQHDEEEEEEEDYYDEEEFEEWEDEWEEENEEGEHEEEEDRFIDANGKIRAFVEGELAADKPSNPISRYLDQGEISMEESYRSHLKTSKDQESLKEDQKVLNDHLENRTEESDKATQLILTERLKSFRTDEWVRKQIKASNVYFDTELELENSFNGFEISALSNPLAYLNIASKEEDPLKLNRKLFPFFLSYVSSQTKYVDKKEESTLENVINLRAPHEWYTAARRMKRKIICHVGPTNSGKTFTALQSLAEASSGIYCGPLRLLAYEVFEKLNEKDVPCNLITGQQKIGVEGAQHSSCTVEMAEINKLVDVAVIDEIQMIGNGERGWAWTRAFLGIMAKEIHVCGDPSALKLIQNMCELTGDTCEIKEYERLSPLKMDTRPMGDIKDLQKGDCIIAFSRNDIYDWKMKIEEQTGRKVCIIYGGLPPEARRQQAELFNNPENRFDILVASDAIGMGLNLNIRRIIFSKIDKFDGTQRRKLLSTEVKQIAGRAGRFKSIYPDGKVNTFDSSSMQFVDKMLKSKIRQLPSAGILPSFEHLEEFAGFLKPNTKFHKIVDLFMEAAETDRTYFLCDHKNLIGIAKAIDLIPMSMKDRYMFCISPVDVDNPDSMSYLVLYAGQYSFEKKVDLSVDHTTVKQGGSKKEIQELEILHNICDLYIWFSYRAPEFHQRELAQKTKQDIVERIRTCLTKLGTTKKREMFEEAHTYTHRSGRGKGFKGKKIKPRKRGESLYDDLDDDLFYDEDDIHLDDDNWLAHLDEYASGRR